MLSELLQIKWDKNVLVEFLSLVSWKIITGWSLNFFLIFSQNAKSKPKLRSNGLRLLLGLLLSLLGTALGALIQGTYSQQLISVQFVEITKSRKLFFSTIPENEKLWYLLCGLFTQT